MSTTPEKLSTRAPDASSIVTNIPSTQPITVQVRGPSEQPATIPATSHPLEVIVSTTSATQPSSAEATIDIRPSAAMPIALRTMGGLGAGDGKGISRLLLMSRRFSITVILFLGFFYFYMTRDSDALAPIGLISFAGVAQFLPAILAALFWREASVKGATAAVAIGFVVWAWSMFLPSFGTSSVAVATLMAEGPWGISWLRPEALFGLDELDPLVHSVFWSLFLNTGTLIVVSLLLGLVGVFALPVAIQWRFFVP